MKSSNYMLLFLALLAMLFSSESTEAKSKPYNDRISLNGTWDFRTIAGAFTLEQATAKAVNQWRQLSVPQNWHLAGIDYSGTAIYRRSIDVQAFSSEQSAYIVFHGVDYATDVWVNDVHVGSHRGYFQKYTHDVTDHLVVGKNIIHVAVHSPNEDVGATWSLKKQLIKGIFNHHDTRPGGAWSNRGQDRNTGGIWAPVELKITGPATLKNVAFKPSFDDDKNGRTKIQFSLDGVDPEAAQKVSIRLTPKNFPGESVQVTHRLRKTRSNVQTINIDHGAVKLWWPYDLGTPNLYDAEITLYSNGRVSDFERRTFAYRTVLYDTVSGQWRINGKRLFLRGTNYIATQWLSEMDDEDYDIDLGLMRSAHINTVRVHAHISAKALYEAADRMGMLIWQDFPLQWGYDDSPDFLTEAKRQARDMVRLFADHPSIIAWSMQNEPPWDADWMKYKYPNYDPNQNRKLTQTLYDLVLTLDKTRYVHSHSATAEHPWLGWYSGSWLDYAKPTDQKLVTEFGAQALPNAEGLRRIFPEHALFPTSNADWDLWSYHNFQKHELTNVAGVEIGDTLEQFINNTQTYQALLTKFAAENLRRQKYSPVGGAFQFMFNEDWPSVNWGIVDYWRTPKPGYYALKTAYQPVLASLEWKNNIFESGDRVEVGVWIVNDLHNQFIGARYSLSLRTPSEITDAGEYFVDIDVDNAIKIATWSRTLTESGDYTLIARIESQNGELLSVNDYSFSVK